MHEKRMSILRRLYEIRKKSMGPVPAKTLHGELSEDIPEFNEFMSHLFYWVEKDYVYMVPDGQRPVRIEANGIDFYENTLKPWRQRAWESVKDPTRFAAFVYGVAGIIIGVVLGYILGSL